MNTYSVPIFFETEAINPQQARDQVLSVIEGHEFDGPDCVIRVLIGNEKEVTAPGQDLTAAMLKDYNYITEKYFNTKQLLVRAHDIMCSARHADTRPDFSDLIGDIRNALDLPVTDCVSCLTVVGKFDAVDARGRTLCPECAEDEGFSTTPPLQ